MFLFYVFVYIYLFTVHSLSKRYSKKLIPQWAIQSNQENRMSDSLALSDVMGSESNEWLHNPWIHRFLFQNVQDFIFTVRCTDYLLSCKSVCLVLVCGVCVCMVCCLTAGLLGVSPPSSDSNQRR